MRFAVLVITEHPRYINIFFGPSVSISKIVVRYSEVESAVIHNWYCLTDNLRLKKISVLCWQTNKYVFQQIPTNAALSVAEITYAWSTLIHILSQNLLLRLNPSWMYITLHLIKVHIFDHHKTTFQLWTLHLNATVIGRRRRTLLSMT